MSQAARDQNYVTTLLAVSSVDGVTPVTLYANPTTHRLLVDLAGGGSGTVQTIAIASANGFAGTSDADPNNPTLTLSTSITGILKGNGTAISAVTIGSGLSYDGTTLSATASGGNVSNTGTPVNNQIAVWTNSTTIEGDTALTFDTATDTLTVAGEVVTPDVQAASSAGITISANGGSTVATFGAGGGQNATFEDGTTVKGLLTVGSGAANGTIQSNGNFDLILQTGNATTGKITIPDGASGDITIAPNGNSGELIVQNSTATTGKVSAFATGTDANVLVTTGAGNYVDMYASTGGTYVIVADNFDGATGPYVDIYNDSASPAASDVVGEIRFSGEDSASNKQQYASIKGVIADPTSTSEDGKIVFRTITAGSDADELELTGFSLYPTTNDGLALGNTTNQYSDLFLAEGGVINWDNGDVTLTQTNNELVLAGGNLDVGTNTIRTAGDIDQDGTPNTDDTWTGPSTNSFNAGATIAQWEAVYLDSSSTWQLTDADAASTAGSVMIALATAAGTAANPLRVCLPGCFVRNDAWNWTVGGIIYLSTTPGVLTQTAPSATDDVVRICGWAVNADTIFWNPSPDYITIV